MILIIDINRSRSVYNFSDDFLCFNSDCLKWFDLHFLFTSLCF